MGAGAVGLGDALAAVKEVAGLALAAGAAVLEAVGVLGARLDAAGGGAEAAALREVGVGRALPLAQPLSAPARRRDPVPAPALLMGLPQVDGIGYWAASMEKAVR